MRHTFRRLTVRLCESFLCFPFACIPFFDAFVVVADDSFFDAFLLCVFDYGEDCLEFTCNVTHAGQFSVGDAAGHGFFFIACHDDCCIAGNAGFYVVGTIGIGSDCFVSGIGNVFAFCFLIEDICRFFFVVEDVWGGYFAFFAEAAFIVAGCRDFIGDRFVYVALARGALSSFFSKK